MSGDPEQEFFADGITEHIITLLAGWRAFPVIAHTSTFTYRGKAADIKKVGEELSVRYVVEGSVRKLGRRVRVTAQLIQADTGRPRLGRALRPRSRRHFRGAGRDHRGGVRKATLQWLCPAASRANAETITGEVRLGRHPDQCGPAFGHRCRGRFTIVQPVQGRDPELETAGIWQMSDNRASEGTSNCD